MHYLKAHENRIHQYTVQPYKVLSTFEMNQYAKIHRNRWKINKVSNFESDN